MNGLTQHKRRNQSRNENRANWSAFQATADRTYKIKRIFREDLQTGEVTETSRSKMNAEVWLWSKVFHPYRRYALPQSLAWEELEKGALLFTDSAKFWIDNPSEVPEIPKKSEPTDDEYFFQAGEVDRHYQDVV